MSEQVYCTCEKQTPVENETGIFCGWCGNTISVKPPQVLIDRALLVRLARLVFSVRLADLMFDGYTIDEADALREACQQILREYGE